MAYECLDIVGINNPCEDVSSITLFLDELGLSLAKASEGADERYAKGQTMVDAKIALAKQDVLDHLFRNIRGAIQNGSCDPDQADGIICDAKDVIGKAIWYRSAALLYKDIVVDSMRYNEYVAYGKESAITNVLLYDSSFAILAGPGVEVPPGQYQMALENLEPVRRDLEQICVTDCVGTRYQFVLP